MLLNSSWLVQRHVPMQDFPVSSAGPRMLMRIMKLRRPFVLRRLLPVQEKKEHHPDHSRYCCRPRTLEFRIQARAVQLRQACYRSGLLRLLLRSSRMWSVLQVGTCCSAMYNFIDSRVGSLDMIRNSVTALPFFVSLPALSVRASIQEALALLRSLR